MAFETYDIHGQRSSKRYQSAAANATANSLAVGSSVTLDQVLIDNSTNTHKVYLKLYANSSPTIGTTAPDCVLVCAASTSVSYTFSFGIAFTNFSYACVQEAGTSGTTSPTNSVQASILVH